MTTLTLEVPEDLAERLSLLPERERTQHIVSYLRAGMELLAPVKTEGEYRETIEGITAGFTDLDSGRTIDVDVFFDRFEVTRRR